MSELRFSDLPAEIDLLNNEQIHDAFAELIKRATRPFVMAVIGPWGSGKTTLIRHSLKRLKKHYHFAEFNAWSHSKGMPLLKGLFAHLATQKGGTWDKVKSELTKLVKSPIASATIRGLGLLGGPIGTALAELTAESLSKGNEDDNIEVFIEDFKKVADIFEKEKKPLLIFIDDLDRCTPTEALDLIDDMKVYLTIDAPVVFIVALDRRTLQMGIKAKYGLESEISVDEYLQKIFSHVVYIPEYYILDDFINDAVKCIPFKGTIDLLSIAKKVFTECEIKNIRTIKRMVRKWVLLIPSNINDYLKRPGVEERLHSKTDQLAMYILLLCVLLELYPEYYEILIRLNIAKDDISRWLGTDQAPIDDYFGKYLMAKGAYRTRDFKEEITELKNKEPILVQIMQGLFSATFLEHSNQNIVKKAYEESLPELVKAVHLGIPLIS
jgi:hypothetical protein